jgi:hypothetical protein
MQTGDTAYITIYMQGAEDEGDIYDGCRFSGYLVAKL